MIPRPLTPKELIKDIKKELKKVKAKIDKDYKRGIINKALIEHNSYLIDQLIRYTELEIEQNKKGKIKYETEKTKERNRNDSQLSKTRNENLLKTMQKLGVCSLRVVE